ncbi:MAG: hypothetical protein NTZ10_03220 [Candidatus Saganbacteria bacterium]|nr:hypothetical protein [Candidatus Saganbacteria bacterium]
MIPKKKTIYYHRKRRCKNRLGLALLAVLAEKRKQGRSFLDLAAGRMMMMINKKEESDVQ